MITRGWLLMFVLVSAVACGTSARPITTDGRILPDQPPVTTTAEIDVERPEIDLEEGLTQPDSPEATALLGWSSASIRDQPSPAPHPSWIQIPALRVSARVVAMGVDGQGQMEVPENVEDVGWYRFGVSPGEEGSAVLAAHVDLAGEGPGVFFDIDSLAAGDTITITFSDDNEESFAVERVERIAKGSLDVDSLFDRSGNPRVRLVTCGGDFNPYLRRYSDNVIVTLVPEAGN